MRRGKLCTLLVDPLSWLVYALALGAGVFFVRRDPDRRGLLRAARALWRAAVSVCFLTLLVGHSVFGVMRALCWGGFLAAPVGLLLGAFFVRGGWRWASLALGLVLGGVGVDAFLVEPQALEVETVQVRSAKVDAPFRIVVLSDIQTDQVDDFTRRAIATGLAQDPDLVLLPGDYIQRSWGEGPETFEEDRAALNAAFVEAGLGEVPWVAVEGDIDDSRWPQLFGGIPSGHASPSTATVELEGVVIEALSVGDSRRRIQIEPREELHIAVGHAPDFALARPPVDLLVAGHTHGGQVVLPFVGPLMTLTELPREQASGHTTLEDGSHLVVSRGIGMERIDAPRIRLLCRPQVVVIELLPEA